MHRFTDRFFRNQPVFTAVALLITAVFVLFASQAATAAPTLVTDDFSSGDYTGGTGWTGNWTEDNDSGGSSGGSILISGGRLLLEGSTGTPVRALIRNVDLTGAASATLTFDWECDGDMEAGQDYFRAEYSADGGSTWQPLVSKEAEVDMCLEPGNNDSGTESNLSLAAALDADPSDTYIRFESELSAATEDVYVDNVVVSYETATAGEISGVVFRDYNANGTRDSLEPGEPDITVYAIDTSGATATDTTDTNGAYTITGLTGEVRLEFRPTDKQTNYLAPGAAGNTTVQFADIDAGATLNVGFSNPSEYAQSNPTVIVPVQVNGDPAGGGSAGTFKALASFAYNASGTGAPTAEADFSDIGSTWGIAYQRSTETAFISAHMKRHSGFGSLGTGGIYTATFAGGSTTIDTFIDVTSIGIDTGTDVTSRNLPADGTTPNNDPNAFDAVGKRSIGDIDINEDEDTLWLVNLFDQSLYSIYLNDPFEVPDASDVTQYTLPDSECNNGVYRPWGLEIHDDVVYVGGVCTAENVGGTAADLDAHIYALDLNGTAPITFTTFYTMDLDYPRGFVTASGSNPPADWRPWIDDWNDMDNPVPGTGPFGKQIMHPQPILSDIDFDNNGSLILSIMDRAGHQLGNDNYATTGTTTYEGVAGGDLIRICNTTTGLQLEDNGVCPGETPVGGNGDGSSTSPAQGPGGGEYYWQDMYTLSNNEDGGTHNEIALGSTLFIHGQSEVMSTIFDPINGNVRSGGIGMFDNTDGTRPRSYQVYGTDEGGTPTTFGKVSGLGDLTLLAEAAPIEIGNRLWQDNNGNGVQDPGEPGLNNVTLELWADTNDNGSADTKVAETTTDADGNYLFSTAGTNSFGETENWSFTTVNDVARETAYEVRVATNQAIFTSNNLSLTSADAAQPAGGDAPVADNNPFTDLADSDATPHSSLADTAVIAYTTGRAGSNNHTLDMGFSTTDKGDLPDSFDTNLTSSGPTHTVVNNLYLGACVDADSDGQPDAEAGVDGTNGDDNNTGFGTQGTCASNDDEDGMALLTPLVAGNEACVALTAVNGTGSAANLYGFIDYNGDGDFDADTDDLLTGGTNGATFTGGVATVPNGGVSNATYCFDVPAGATFDGGETHLRFRLTTDTLTGNQWAGPATNGEVEDYYTPLACVGNYLWIDTGTTADEQDAGDTAVADGTTVNLVWGGLNGVIGTGGDDITYATTTTSGIYQFCGLPEGLGEFQVTVPNSPASPVTADQGSDDGDSDGTVNGSASEGPVFSVTIPNAVTDGATNDTDPNNYPDDRTDLTFDFGFDVAADRGDLPDSFDTTTANGGPSHIIVNNLYLGTCVDEDSDGQPDNEAGVDGTGGDDTNTGFTTQGTCSGSDDEDGGTLITPLIAGYEACMLVTAVNGTGSAANLYGFIDYNGDGDFDADTDDLLTGGTNGATFTGGVATVPDGGVSNAIYCFDVPAGATFDGGETHLRFRLTTDALTGNQWAGPATNGEVEDYYTPLACVGNYLWIDTGTTADEQDAGDTAVANTAVNLVWGGNNGVIGTGGDDVTYTTTTDASGRYEFCGLPEGLGDFQVVVPTSPGTPVTPNQGSDDGDSDGTPNGTASEGQTFTISIPNSVTDGATNDDDPNNYPDPRTDLTFDFGFTPDYDWGDHEDPLDTSSGENGPRHRIDGTTYLGSCVDAEGNGQPGAPATDDDNNTGLATTGVCATPGDDEDGVTPTGNFSDGTGNIDVVSTVNACVNVWFDFTDGATFGADGDFDDTYNPGGFSEHVIVNQAVTGGVNNLSYPLPVTAANNLSGAHLRVRLTPQDGGGGCANAEAYGGLGSVASTGFANGGEVEDYVIDFNPTAVTLSGIDTTEPVNASWPMTLMTLVLGLFTGVVLWRANRRKTVPMPLRVEK